MQFLILKRMCSLKKKIMPSYTQSIAVQANQEEFVSSLPFFWRKKMYTVSIQNVIYFNSNSSKLPFTPMNNIYTQAALKLKCF